VRLDEQIDELQFKIVNIVDWFHEEFDIPFHAIVGILEDVKKDYMDAHNITFESDAEPEEPDEKWR